MILKIKMISNLLNFVFLTLWAKIKTNVFKYLLIGSQRFLGHRQEDRLVRKID
jgi:hypothetical protein